jgi:eukaryotic-like serine/threonine-protein kinase
MEGPGSVGDYRLLREIGRGGLGVVFLATDERDGRQVAVKMLQMADPRMTRRMEREFRAISRLEHPNLVRVLDYGLADGTPYLVMDYVEGRALLEHVRSAQAASLGPPPPASVHSRVELLCQLCAALSYIHGHGILHRDLKPANVLIEPAGRVRLIDFGLLKDEAEDEALTETGLVLGTLAYMSPEQIQARRLDCRSDLYSLGVMLFELCCGMRPFQADSRVGLLRAHLTMPPPRPRTLNPAVPEPLQALLLRLLEKEPYDRPASAREVELEMRAALAAIDFRAAASGRPWTNPGGFELQEQTVALSAAAAPELPPRTRLVGRGQELAEIQRSLGSAAGGRLRLLTITGEAGVGKTRLIEEAVAHWRLLGGAVFQSRSHLGDKQAHGLLLPLLRGLRAMDVQPSATAAASALLTRASTEEVDETPASVRVPFDRAGPEATSAAFAALVQRAAQREPVALSLEDVHWSDPLSLGAIHTMLRSLDGWPLKGLVLVLSFRKDVERPEKLDALLQWARREGILHGWDIGQLDEEGSAELVHSLLGRGVSPYFAAWLHRATGGNPALLEGAVRHVAERGALRKGPAGQWSLEVDRGSVPLSEFEEAEGLSAFDVLADDALELARLKLTNLTREQEHVLEVGAMLRRELGLETLAAIVEADEIELLDRLDHLLRQGILEETNEDGDRYRFATEMLRESVARQMSGPRKILVRRRIVTGLERRHAPRPVDRAAIDLAEHALGAGLRDKALHYGPIASRRLLEQHLFRDAERLYLRLHELLGPVPADTDPDRAVRLDVVEGLAEAQRARGDYPAAVESFGRMERLAVECCDAGRRIRALRGKAGAALMMMDGESARPLVGQLVELSRGTTPLSEAHALHLQGLLAFHDGMLDRTEELFRASAEAFRLAGAPRELAGIIANLGYIVDCGARYDEARELYEEALALHRSEPATGADLHVVTKLAGNAIRRGDLPAARHWLAETDRLARRLGDQYSRLLGWIAHGQLLKLEGDTRAARDRFEQVFHAARRLESADVELEVRLELCALDALQDPAETVPRLEAALAEARTLGLSQFEIRAQAALAGLRLKLGAPAEARQHALAALEGAKRTGFRWSARDAEAVITQLDASEA